MQKRNFACKMMYCWTFFGFVNIVTGEAVEIMTGSISPEDSKTYVQRLGNGTTGSYSTVTWSYHVKSRLHNEPEDNPILFFRHTAEDTRYNTVSGCFGNEFHYNYGLDTRMVTLTPFDKMPGLDKTCTPDGHGYITCSGSLKIAIGFESQFYVSVGFRCEHESPLDVNFNFSITAIPDGEVPCTNWSDAINELQEPVYPGLKLWLQECSTFYPQFSRWNMLGLSQQGYLNMFLIESKLLESNCYKHLLELACRVFVPECLNSTVISQCADACDDFNNGCGRYYTGSDRNNEFENHGVQFNLTCLSFARVSDSPTKPCIYRDVNCSKVPKLPKNVKIMSQNGSVATSVTRVSCDRFYRPSDDSSGLKCLYDGEWHWMTESTCNIGLGYILGTSLVLGVLVVVILTVLIYKFRFEIKLLSYKYLSCLLCCFCCCLSKENSNKAYHAFIAYNSEQQRFVKTNIYEPLINSGYKVCVDFANFIPSTHLPTVIPDAISKSYRVIIILNQQFLDSEWGKYELDQALMQSLEDASLTFLIILMQDKSTLTNVPRWLKGYLRTHIYIEVSDPFFRGKIIQGMPSKTVNAQFENEHQHVLYERHNDNILDNERADQVHLVF